MAYNFLPCDRSQAYLLPPSLTDWPLEDFVQGLNGRAVTTEEQIIIAEDATQE